MIALNFWHIEGFWTVCFNLTIRARLKPYGQRLMLFVITTSCDFFEEHYGGTLLSPESAEAVADSYYDY